MDQNALRVQFIESIAADAREVGGTVNIEGAARLPYIGHPQSLKRCLTNLVDNAVKYGGTPSVITIEYGRGELAQNFIHIGDQGPGIPHEDCEKVFDMFYRVDQGDAKSAGTGLGLAICRGIVEAHGGTIKAEPGIHEAGTAIIIHLPQRRDLDGLAAQISAEGDQGSMP